MYTKTVMIILLLVLALTNPVFADGSDAADNYVAGTNAGSAITTGIGNTLIGVDAGFSATTGRANVAIGYRALPNLTTGIGNIAIGYMAGEAYTTDSHKLYIGNRYYPDYSISGDLSTGEFTVSGQLRTLQEINSSDANDVLTAAQVGRLHVARPITGKRTVTLPAASAGLWFDFFVADADTLRITVAAGDSILTSAGAAVVTQTTVAGTLRLVAIDAVRWVMQNAQGTWTGY